MIIRNRWQLMLTISSHAYCHLTRSPQYAVSSLISPLHSSPLHRSTHIHLPRKRIALLQIAASLTPLHSPHIITSSLHHTFPTHSPYIFFSKISTLISTFSHLSSKHLPHLRHLFPRPQISTILAASSLFHKYPGHPLSPPNISSLLQTSPLTSSSSSTSSSFPRIPTHPLPHRISSMYSNISLHHHQFNYVPPH